LFGLIKATAPPAVIDRIRKGGPTQGWDPGLLSPRACARGYILVPLRG